MANTDQENITELQMRLAFLEQNLDELNDVITSQQAQISLLERAVKHLNSRIEQSSSANVRSAEDETPPPHY